MDEEVLERIVERCTDLKYKIIECTANANDYETRELLKICKAIEGLENKISSLKVLQQMQRNDLKLVLHEVERSFKIAKSILKECTGKDLVVERNNAQVLQPAQDLNPEVLESFLKRLSQAKTQLLGCIQDLNDDARHKVSKICESIDFFSNDLSLFKGLQLDQMNERRAAHFEIESSRAMVLKSVEEYRGKELEVIREVFVFASVNGEQNQPPNVLQNHNLDEIVGNPPRNENVDKIVGNPPRNEKGLGFILSTVAKTVLALVGVASVLSLCGFRPKFATSNDLPQQPTTKDKRSTTDCPPRRVLVVEDGKSECVDEKERVFVPFSSVAKPDINYGCG